MPAVQFGRECFVSIVEEGSSAPVKQIVGYNSTSSERYGLRISFNVEKALTNIADNASVRIYNLAPESRKILAQRSVYITGTDNPRYLQVSAGYKDNISAIFNGTITRVTNTRDGADWVTEIEASTALAQALGNNLNKSWELKGNTDTKAIVNDLFKAAKLGEPVISVEALAVLTKRISNTHSVSGSAYGSIKQLLESTGLAWSIDVAGSYVLVPGQPKTKTPVEISESTGMLGTPKTSDMGADIRTLINPQITPGALIRVDSKTLEETAVNIALDYTVMSSTFVGDTHTEDWYSDLHCWYYPPVVKVTGATLGQKPIAAQKS